MRLLSSCAWTTVAVMSIAPGARASAVALLTEGMTIPGTSETLTTISVGFSASQSIEPPYVSRSTGALSTSILTNNASSPRMIWGRSSFSSSFGSLLTPGNNTDSFAAQTAYLGGSVLAYSRQFTSNTDQRTYRGGTEIAKRGDSAPGGGFYNFATGSKGNDGSIAVFYSATSPSAFSSSTGAGIFQNDGVSTTRIIGSGDSVSGAIGGGSIALSGSGAVSVNFRVAGTGTTVHYITGGTTSSSSVIFKNGQILTSNGLPIQEGGLVGGGNGTEIWDQLTNDSWNISNNGNWIVAADSNADSEVDDLLIVNGNIVTREGATVDGTLLTGISSVGINDNGDYVFVSNSKLFVNQSVLLSVGDTVTLADGSTATLANFLSSTGALSMTNRDGLNQVTIYFHGRTGGTTSSFPDSLFAITTVIPEPTSTALLVVGGMVLIRRRRV